ncbi:MAG: OmpA family protein [Alphaproteobacteria bacterium]|nr:OmpA family protein [Alphaproteobacteria bacterium]
MRISILIIALSSVLLLTDCGKTMDAKLAAMERAYGPMPTGYTTDYKVPAPKAPETETAPAYTAAPVPIVVSAPAPVTKAKPAAEAEPKAEAGSALVWNEIGAYDAAHPSLPAKSAAVKKLSVPILYDDVSVFPVDGDAEPYQDMKYDFTVTAANIPVAMESKLPVQTAQQVFFGYGSAKVEGADRQRLKKLAANINRTDREYRVNVIGHASKRVDHVMDPVKRKMINFVMAQKRANAVTHELYAAGMTPDWVTAASRGDEVPNPHPGSRTQEAADRRVDVYVEPGSQTYR